MRLNKKITIGRSGMVDISNLDSKEISPEVYEMVEHLRNQSPLKLTVKVNGNQPIGNGQTIQIVSQCKSD